MEQAIQAIKGPIHSKLVLTGAKSISLRALLLAALADGVSEITNLPLSPNIRLFINALKQLGIVTQIDEKNRSCIIAGGNDL